MSVLGVTRFQHRGEPSGFLLSASLGAGFFEAATYAELLQRLFPVEFLFETSNRFLYRFTLSQSNLGHMLSLLCPSTAPPRVDAASEACSRAAHFAASCSTCFSISRMR